MCADGDATLSAMNFAMNIVQGKDIMVVCAQLIVLAYTAGATAETKHFRKRHGRQHRPAVICEEVCFGVLVVLMLLLTH